MAINGDNSKNMSPEEIKQIWANAINRSAEKVASELHYDKTILATIQYCTDASQGQYKIQYQNGYYTAYALDKTTVYSQGAAVYVNVPGNDMNNKKFITGVMNDDNALRVFTSNLEGDKQYSIITKNLLMGESGNGFDISSYEPNAMVEKPGYVRTLYDSANEGSSNLLHIDEDELRRYLAEKRSSQDGNKKYLRFGATFKTNFLEYRKMYPEADYGVRLIISYKVTDETSDTPYFIDKIYELNTFNMSGNPFEFTADSPRYAYFEIEAENFAYIHKIEEYAFGFPDIDPEDTNTPDFKDIHIKNLSLNCANKVYTYEDNTYVLRLETPTTGNTLGAIDSHTLLQIDEIIVKATFSVKGNDVDEKLSNLKFYWGKEDVSVNSVSHSKYNAYLGKGWRCLNQWYPEQTDSTSAEDIKNYVRPNTEYPDSSVKKIGWYSLNPASFTAAQLKGKETVIRCVVLYENVPYHADITLYNLNGKYVMIKSDNGTEFYNGSGVTSLSAGVFQNFRMASDQPWTLRNWTLNDPINPNQLSNITYVWEEVDYTGVTRAIPLKESPNLFLGDFEPWDVWSQTYDNIEISDDGVAENLANVSIDYSTCIQRYNYYNNYANDASNSAVSRETARQRAQYTIDKRDEQLKAAYIADNVNLAGNYIIGPGNVIATYSEAGNPDTAKITSVEKYYYSQQQNSNYYKYFGNPNLVYPKGNVLYNIRAYKILQHTTYKVTALEKDNLGNYDSIATEEITITNTAGSTLDYDLQIINGTQTFIYNESGLSPTSENGSDNLVLIKPLGFKLYNKSGDLILSSDDQDQEGQPTVVDKVQPKWRFPIAKTLIKTKYKGTNNYYVDSDDLTLGWISDARVFSYDIAEQYNIDYKDSSNILLQIKYNGQTITASTNFTFVKQGELGTNGTDKYLAIEDAIYLNYKSDVLSNPVFCTFEDVETDTKEERFDPNQRHLKNGYLYATEAYTANKTKASSIHDSDAIYVNLQFAQNPVQQNNSLMNEENIYAVQGSPSIQIFGYWYGDGMREPIDGESLWYIDIGSNMKNNPYYTQSSFRMNNKKSDTSPVKGASMTLTIPWINDTIYPLYYKPTPISNFSVPGVQGTFTRVANNIVQCKSTQTLSSDYKVDNYGYFPIPYFYYHVDTHNGAPMPQNLDPSRYFVITGGYDQVIYNSAGFDPQYNKQAPFGFHLFDINHNDITKKIVESNNAIIQWQCSEGFQQTPKIDLTNLYEYTDNTHIPRTQSLLGVICKYQGKVWRCVVNHIKAGKKSVIVEGSKISEEYADGAFVFPYWEEISNTTLLNGNREMYFNPDPVYESVAQASLFNSWITVYVNYTDPDTGYTYDAEALLPINVLCNKYGSEEINNWDGKKTVVDDSYIISSKIAAGVKNDDNTFTGINIGKTMYKDTGKEEVGIFGYGRYRVQGKDPNGNAIGSTYNWGRTLFVDANSGLSMFGPSGSSQIILNPSLDHIYDSTGEQDWSKLAGWYFSRNFLYKPLGEDNTPKSYREILDMQKYSGSSTDPDDIFKPMETPYGSVGIYAPWHVGEEDEYGIKAELDSDTVFIWASAAKKDLGSAEKKAVIDRKQRTMKSKWGVLFRDYDLEVKNRTEVVHNLDVVISQWVRIKRALQKRLAGEAPVVSYNSQTGEERWDDLPKDLWDAEVGAYTTEQQLNDAIDNATDEISDATDNKNDAVNEIDVVYRALLDDYNNTVHEESQGQATTYKTFNDKKSNFYVTYGGHLHAASADVEGKIVADSGEFGSGTDKIKIAYLDENGQNYIFYNKNFWVKDSSNIQSELDPTAYIKGCIMANAGQFGAVNKNKDGDNADIVSIQYSWYPYSYPRADDFWGKGPDGETHAPAPDKSQGKNTKYIIHHPNFHIKSDGTSYMKGTVYASAGRIGNFNLNTKQIWDCVNTIRLKPGLNENDRGYLQLGQIFIMDDGDILCFTKQGVPRPPQDPSGSIENGQPMSASEIRNAWGRMTNRRWSINSSGQLVQYGAGAIAEQSFDTNEAPTISKKYNANNGSQTVANSETGEYSEVKVGQWKSKSITSANQKELTIDGNDFTNMNILSASTTVDNTSLQEWIKELLKSWHVLTGIQSTSTYISPETGGSAVGSVSGVVIS